MADKVENQYGYPIDSINRYLTEPGFFEKEVKRLAEEAGAKVAEIIRSASRPAG